MVYFMPRSRITDAPFLSLAGPPTKRSGQALAEFHGFESIRSLAESIPEGAHVIDVGAGFSTFGHSVTKLRDDIHWINFDAVYSQARWDGFIRKMLLRLQDSARDNLAYVSGSIL